MSGKCRARPTLTSVSESQLHRYDAFLLPRSDTTPTSDPPLFMVSGDSAPETVETAIGGLGEIALRVDELDEMQLFYEEVVGLELLRRFDDIAFFDIAPGIGGHTQILALFDRSGVDDYTPPEGECSTLDHFAFEIPLSAYDDERERLAGHDIDLREKTFEWVQWRSLFFRDPEDNLVELVAHDPSIDQHG